MKINPDSGFQYFSHSGVIFLYLSRFVFYLGGKKKNGFHIWLKNTLINKSQRPTFDFVPCQVEDKIHLEINKK